MKNTHHFRHSAMATIAAACLLTAIPAPVNAGPADLLPKPTSLELMDCEAFQLGRAVRLTDPTDCALLKEILQSYGCTLTDEATAPTITVEIVGSIEGAFLHNVPYMPEEAYTLNVTTTEVRIQASSAPHKR